MECAQGTHRLVLDDAGVAQVLYGPGNKHLQLLQAATSVEIAVRGTELCLDGMDEDVALVRQIIEELYGLVREGRPLYANDVEQALRIKGQDRRICHPGTARAGGGVPLLCGARFRFCADGAL